MDTYHVIGLMTGSSLDGLDIAYCKFEYNDGWKFELLDSRVVEHPERWRLRLGNLVLQNAVNYLKTDVFFGHYLGELVNTFIEEKGIRDQVDFIVSHGQTIFHQPENKLSRQIGDGAAIAAETSCMTICDLRSTDVALGGQGAPIVPKGEQMLFPENKLFLNLGGIGNISAHLDNKIIAFDICAANTPMNLLAAELNLDYDKDGEMARQGIFNKELFDNLNKSWYFTKEYPKSLSGGWVSKVFNPVLNKSRLDSKDKLHTLCMHIAYQTNLAIEMIEETEKVSFTENDEIVVSGGGALNTFLVEKISEACKVKISTPSDDIVNFKEAIIMAFLGVLRVRNEPNTLSSVTGSSFDNINGAIYAAPK